MSCVIDNVGIRVFYIGKFFGFDHGAGKGKLKRWILSDSNYVKTTKQGQDGTARGCTPVPLSWRFIRYAQAAEQAVALVASCCAASPGTSPLTSLLRASGSPRNREIPNDKVPTTFSYAP